MATSHLGDIAAHAMRLQNGYALAIDTRDWDYFRTLFVTDVEVQFPRGHEYTGIDAWLDYFVPNHEKLAWTEHVMTNHVVGEDAGGVWACCYGSITLLSHERPGLVSWMSTLYRDRLVQVDGTWLIGRRRCQITSSHTNVPIAEGRTFPTSIRDLADTR